MPVRITRCDAACDANETLKVRLPTNTSNTMPASRSAMIFMKTGASTALSRPKLKSYQRKQTHTVSARSADARRNAQKRRQWSSRNWASKAASGKGFGIERLRTRLKPASRADDEKSRDGLGAAMSAICSGTSMIRSLEKGRDRLL